MKIKSCKNTIITATVTFELPGVPLNPAIAAGRPRSEIMFFGSGSDLISYLGGKRKILEQNWSTDFNFKE